MISPEQKKEDGSYCCLRFFIPHPHDPGHANALSANSQIEEGQPDFS
jgi:hypothetical protein